MSIIFAVAQSQSLSVSPSASTSVSLYLSVCLSALFSLSVSPTTGLFLNSTTGYFFSCPLCFWFSVLLAKSMYFGNILLYTSPAPTTPMSIPLPYALLQCPIFFNLRITNGVSQKLTLTLQSQSMRSQNNVSWIWSGTDREERGLIRKWGCKRVIRI